MGPFGVRSNVVAPGMIGGTEGGESNVFGSYEATQPPRTPTDADPSSSPLADRLTPKGGEDVMAGRIPLQRIGSKDDVANLCVFVFSDAGNYLTGTKFVVDGGAVHNGGFWLPYPESSLDQKMIGQIVQGSRL